MSCERGVSFCVLVGRGALDMGGRGSKGEGPWQRRREDEEAEAAASVHHLAPLELERSTLADRVHNLRGVPEDLFCDLVSRYVSVYDLGRASSVCRTWRRLVLRRDVWALHFHAIFGAWPTAAVGDVRGVVVDCVARPTALWRPPAASTRRRRGQLSEADVAMTEQGAATVLVCPLETSAAPPHVRIVEDGSALLDAVATPRREGGATWLALDLRADMLAERSRLLPLQMRNSLALVVLSSWTEWCDPASVAAELQQLRNGAQRAVEMWVTLMDAEFSRSGTLRGGHVHHRPMVVACVLRPEPHSNRSARAALRWCQQHGVPYVSADAQHQQRLWDVVRDAMAHG